MIYAIATSNEKLSHRFSQSESFDFYDQQGQRLARIENPALTTSCCQGKTQLINMLTTMGCKTVIVRKIGQKTLAKLLMAGIEVEQGNTRHSVTELLAQAKARSHSLTCPDQGVLPQNGSCQHAGCHGHINGCH
ncbi:NifB/NifX family molybdenum-iron cluster-binding protein [Motilimonas cestriensis]|uniref:NifB/NifX family molybdenum-iron cluster-binding protein n=1 Tax=Motilimonas cestriensis TaxID=2742685 RepID=UPI003DA6084B